MWVGGSYLLVVGVYVCVFLVGGSYPLEMAILLHPYFTAFDQVLQLVDFRFCSLG